jgi:dihydroorotate dehydrogenase
MSDTSVSAAKPPRLYGLLYRTILTRIEAERAHKLGALVIRVCGWPLIGAAVRACSKPRRDIGVNALGLTFATPFGLAAGFDKDAEYIRGLANLGFGHVEIGTLTAQAQPGNDKPRMFRLVDDFAVVNRMGFNNGGAAGAVERLRSIRRWKRRPVVGVNIGKSRVVAVEDAIEDYVTSTKLVAELADYLVVNVSSPNTPGLRGLQEIDQLRPLLSAVKNNCGATPLLVKIAPDLSDPEIVKVTELATELGLAGIIATNTTLSRAGLASNPARVEEIGAGGLSGRPLKQRAMHVLQVIAAHAPKDLCVISVGGVETAEDVTARLNAGADLVQGYSAFVYWGPGWARSINRELSK